MNEKTRENRLRRNAERQGLRLAKSRRQAPMHPDGPYFISDPYNNTLVSRETGLDLDEVEQFLSEEGT